MLPKTIKEMEMKRDECLVLSQSDSLNSVGYKNIIRMWSKVICSQRLINKLDKKYNLKQEQNR